MWINLRCPRRQWHPGTNCILTPGRHYCLFVVAAGLAVELAKALGEAGVGAAFGVPGGGPNLDLVGALLDIDIDFILAHAESSAAIMAATHGLITQTPTPVIVTRGPGATSVANGTAQATLDRFPLIVVTDTVPAAQRQRVAHQRVDQRAFFAPITKASATVAADVDAETLVGLLTVPTTWPFGAVHLDYDASGHPDADAHLEVVVAPDTGALSAAISAAVDLVGQAERPVVIVGMEAAATPELAEILVRFGAPVLSTYQAAGLVDTNGSVGAGLFTNGALERPVLDAADLIITVGLDLVEPIPAPWTQAAPVVRLSSVIQLDDYLPATIDVVGPLAETARTVLQPNHRWADGEATALCSQARDHIRHAESSDTFGPVQLVETAIAALPETITTTVDAGAHFLAVMPLWPVSEPFRLLISNGLATMAFAVPAAIGAAIARPGEPVLAFTGDGGMSMTMAELETIARLQLPITVVVFNDATLSLIRIKQTAEHGGDRAVAYQLTDFAEVARASGIDGYVVNSALEFRTVLAQDWDRPRLIDARIDPSSYPALLAATRG